MNHYKIIRNISGYTIALPFYILFLILRLFLKRETATDLLRPAVKRYVALLAEITIIPQINTSADFDKFMKKLKRNINFFKPLYDIGIQHEDGDKIILCYSNCPHCEAFLSLGLPELSKAACDSDWVIADKNRDFWLFERNHQIGSGDMYCDHTYIRKD